MFGLSIRIKQDIMKSFSDTRHQRVLSSVIVSNVIGKQTDEFKLRPCSCLFRNPASTHHETDVTVVFMLDCVMLELCGNLCKK